MQSNGLDDFFCCQSCCRLRRILLNQHQLAILTERNAVSHVQQACEARCAVIHGLLPTPPPTPPPPPPQPPHLLLGTLSPRCFLGPSPLFLAPLSSAPFPPHPCSSDPLSFVLPLPLLRTLPHLSVGVCACVQQASEARGAAGPYLCPA